MLSKRLLTLVTFLAYNEESNSLNKSEDILFLSSKSLRRLLNPCLLNLLSISHCLATLVVVSTIVSITGLPLDCF